MFVHIIPAVAVMLMFMTAVITEIMPVFWLTAWWFIGSLCAILLSYVKGESFGGSIRYITSIVAIGSLGFILVPYAVPAIFLAFNLMPCKWMRAAEKRDQRIAKWALAGYPHNEEFKDLLRD